MSYWRFLAMILTSTAVMFGLMYLNTFLFTHIFWSETRAYMAILMGATMAIVMLAFMLSMYSSKLLNTAIFAGAVLVFGCSLWLVRSQATVGDTSYMRAMIPHHSIAIMTSSRAQLSDSRVRKLADEIIYAQDKEIAEMRFLVDDIEASGDSNQPEPSATARIVSVQEALSTAEVAILDPEFLSDEEMGMLFAEGPACSFSYTTQSEPVLAIGKGGNGTAGLFKISGDLVRLDEDRTNSGLSFATEGASLRLTAADGGALNARPGSPQDAILRLQLDAGLQAGYRGYYSCAAA
ncbi:DUF305 domain-containing protein [Notoacmeibacter sp. MSK16QG-6]|uniref:DUF305 domain-containing protein n=1 Tax=Notoacmeibacter sp. MSK16QG-6 TaxID=2957982 RepID=UPI0020A19E60|nr:DUF305 domain-containing protein [Notoacmeibacter sp. MSK16QG-6]MCP1198850.1 DUF305 domain-containing protein [Notoacmeibacter sp. MSK16QG-6]